MSERLCRCMCGRQTNRRCGICVQCCDSRDERNKRIDAGTARYPANRAAGASVLCLTGAQGYQTSPRRKGKGNENGQYSLETWGRRGFQCVNVRFSAGQPYRASQEMERLSDGLSAMPDPVAMHVCSSHFSELPTANLIWSEHRKTNVRRVSMMFFRPSALRIVFCSASKKPVSRQPTQSQPKLVGVVLPVT
jgi:hypothetical protein